MEVGARQQAVVVEHLLEVGDEPDAVDRVASEAAAELVVDAAGQHRVERLPTHLGLAAGQQQLERGGGRELRRAAEAAVLAVGGGEQALGRRRQHRSPAPPAGSTVAEAPAAAASRRPLADRLAFGLEGVDHGFHHHPEARHAAALVGREVGAAVEGDAVGVEEDGHRPAAVAGHRLHRLHVDRVDVGALLAVDLDRDEVLVHVGRRSPGPRTTRAPSRGTSGRPSSRPRAGSAGPPRAPAPAPPRPRDTSRRGCSCAAGGTDWSRRRGG